jgi:hypothetical protein
MNVRSLSNHLFPVLFFAAISGAHAGEVSSKAEIAPLHETLVSDIDFALQQIREDRLKSEDLRELRLSTEVNGFFRVSVNFAGPPKTLWLGGFVQGGKPAFSGGLPGSSSIQIEGVDFWFYAEAGNWSPTSWWRDPRETLSISSTHQKFQSAILLNGYGNSSGPSGSQWLRVFDPWRYRDQPDLLLSEVRPSSSVGMNRVLVGLGVEAELLSGSLQNPDRVREKFSEYGKYYGWATVLKYRELMTPAAPAIAAYHGVLQSVLDVVNRFEASPKDLSYLTLNRIQRDLKAAYSNIPETF